MSTTVQGMRRGALAGMLAVSAALAGPAAGQDAAGDRRTFTSRTVETTTGPGGGRQSNHQTFEVETLAVTADGLSLRYTLKDAAIEDTRDPGLPRLLRAWIGVPVEIAAGPSGEPREIINWPEARDAYAVALGGGDPILDLLDGLEPAPRARRILSDLRLMAEMQPRIALTPGRTAAPPVMVGDVRIEEVREVVEGECGLTLSRTMTAAPPSPADPVPASLRISAVLAPDGWVNALTRTSVAQDPERRTEETVIITRDGIPACGPDGADAGIS